MAVEKTEEEILAEEMAALQAEIDSGETDLFGDEKPAEPEPEPEPTPEPEPAGDPQGDPEPEHQGEEPQGEPQGEEPTPADEPQGEPQVEPEADPAPENTFEPITMKVGDYDVQITSQEELVAFAKRGIQNAVPKAETHVEEKKILEQAGLTPQDLILLADAKSGNPQAIAKLAQMGNVDTLALREDDAKNYTQGFNPRDYSEVEKVVREIKSNPYEAQKFADVSNTLPKDFIDAVGANAVFLRAFNEHIQSGKAQAIIPEAMKRQMIHGGTLFDHYDKVGAEMYMTQTPAPQGNPQGNPASAQPAQPARTVTPQSQVARNRMGSEGYQPPKGEETAADIMAMSDEDFLASISKGKTY